MHTSQLIKSVTGAGLLFLSFLANPVHASASNNSTLDFFTTADGAKYAYTYTPAQEDHATYLLIHGYPSSHRDWKAQVEALTAEGFGTIVPDMLGFGASDMPTTPEAYNGKRLVGHLAELLDHEGLETVIGVGHDWGSAILSRLAVYHQDRLDKIAWLNVAHQAPGGFFDLDAINAMGAAEFGYMPNAYWYFFGRYDAGTIIREHLDSYWHLIFPENHTVWEEHFAALGASRAWLNADTVTEEAPFFDESYKADWMAWMSRPNATEAGLNYYKSQLGGVNDAEDAELTDEDWLLHVPVLTIGGALDPVTRPDFMEDTESWTTAGYESEILNGGHWLPHELPEEVSQLLIQFGRE